MVTSSRRIRLEPAPDTLPLARRWRPELTGLAAPAQPTLFGRSAASAAGTIDGWLARSQRRSPPVPHRQVVIVRIAPHGPAPGLPDVRRQVLGLARAMVEVLLGRRRPSQVHRFVTDEVQRLLARHVAPTAGADAAAVTLETVRIQLVTDAVVEVYVSASAGARRRVIAFRMVARRRSWRCTEVAVLPDLTARTTTPARHR